MCYIVMLLNVTMYVHSHAALWHLFDYCTEETKTLVDAVLQLTTSL